jgi:PEP-utilising enzyme, mobile domain
VTENRSVGGSIPPLGTISGPISKHPTLSSGADVRMLAGTTLQPTAATSAAQPRKILRYGSTAPPQRSVRDRRRRFRHRSMGCRLRGPARPRSGGRCPSIQRTSSSPVTSRSRRSRTLPGRRFSCRGGGGVVVDVGAVMSHSVIVSRDLGIPCVVSVTDATRIIPDGAMVEIDGDTGPVTSLRQRYKDGVTRTLSDHLPSF